jgi:hypothetical protein
MSIKVGAWPETKSGMKLLTEQAVHDLAEHYMKTLEGREKILVSAYHPAVNLLQAISYGAVPRDRSSARRFERLLELIPLTERAESWHKLNDVISEILKFMV